MAGAQTEHEVYVVAPERNAVPLDIPSPCIKPLRVEPVAHPECQGEVLYSGTVAGAMEGAFLDIPSIAVSQLTDHKMVMHYAAAAEVVQRLLDVFPKAHLSKHSLLNINIPNVPFDELRGTMITELGVRLYDDRFEKRVDPRGRSYYWLAVKRSRKTKPNTATPGQ
ncbi:unnamed protein product [Sphagnum jensenii]